MTAFWPLAYITYKEGIRNRALYGISLFALLLLIINYMISGMIMQDVGKVAIDMALSTISLCGMLLVLFVGINLMAKDLDRRTIYMVLSRPISRSQYIIGKFLGMVMLITTAMLFLSVFALLSIGFAKMSYPNYFPRFSWGMILVAIGYTAFMLVLLSALTFLFASFASTSFITLVLTIITYIIGSTINDVKALLEAPSVVGIHVSEVTVKLVQIAYYVFPNLSFFDLKMQAAHNLPIPLSYYGWTLLYGSVYIGLSITLAALFFRKKEFA